MRRVWKRVPAAVVVAAGAAWLAWPDDLFYARLVPASSAPAANVVGSNVHVSKPHEKHPFTECVLAADPNRPGRLFAASMYWPHPVGQSIVGYLSDDGGATWATSLEVVMNSNGVGAI